MGQDLFQELKQLLIEKNELLNDIISLDKGFINKISQLSFEMGDLDSFLTLSDELVEKLSKKNSKVEEIIDEIKNNDFKLEDSNLRKMIKQLISESEEKVASITELERQCKDKTDAFLQVTREKLGDDRRSTTAAMNYFKVQNNLGIDDSQFDDKK